VSFVLSVLVRSGSDSVLDRLLGLLRRRCIPVSGISFGTGQHGPAPIHLALGTEDPAVVRQAVIQLERLPDVLDVAEEESPGESRQLALIQVNVEAGDQVRLLGVTNPLNTRLITAAGGHVVLEVVSSPDQIDTLISRLQAFGSVTVHRSGMVAAPAPPVPVQGSGTA
jgi:acetolactate synthase small subunit